MSQGTESSNLSLSAKSSNASLSRVAILGEVGYDEDSVRVRSRRQPLLQHSIAIISGLGTVAIATYLSLSARVNIFDF